MSIEVLKTKKDQILKNAIFFSKNDEEIKFDFEIRGYKEISVKTEIVHMASGSKSAPIEMPVKDETVNIGIKNLDGFLELGEYQMIVTLSGERKVILPFFIVEEIGKTQKEWTLKFTLMAKNEKKEDVFVAVDVLAQLINIDNQSVVLNSQMKAKTSKEMGIQLKNEKGWDEGRYEFRLSRGNDIIYRNYYVVK